MFGRAQNMPLDYLNCFGMVLEGYTGTFDICQNGYGIYFSPYSNSYRKYNIQANESSTKIKEK